MLFIAYNYFDYSCLSDPQNGITKRMTRINFEGVARCLKYSSNASKCSDSVAEGVVKVHLNAKGVASQKSLWNSALDNFGKV